MSQYCKKLRCYKILFHMQRFCFQTESMKIPIHNSNKTTVIKSKLSTYNFKHIISRQLINRNRLT